MSRFWVWLSFNVFLAVPIVASIWLAAKRNRSAPFWGFMAVFGGWITFGFLALVSETMGRGEERQARGLEPPDLRSSDTKLAAAPSYTETGPSNRTLLLWIVGMAGLSGLLAITAGMGGRQDARLDVQAVGEEQALINAEALALDLTRPADDLTFRVFVVERVRRMCDADSAARARFSTVLKTSYRNDYIWAVSLRFDDPDPNVLCGDEEFFVTAIDGMPVAAVRSKDAAVLPAAPDGKPYAPTERERPSTWLDDFKNGEGP